MAADWLDALVARLAAGTARAEGLNDYAWRWEIEIQADAPAYVLELDADVLSRVNQLDLSDLAVFNAAALYAAAAFYRTVPSSREWDARRAPIRNRCGAWGRDPRCRRRLRP